MFYKKCTLLLELKDNHFCFRFLLIWLGILKGFPRAWSKNVTIAISAFLAKWNKTRPSDLHRKIRSLNDIKYWKGTEFRTFLLYVGIVALKDRLGQEEYTMFLKYFCAVTICSSDKYRAYLTLARQLFNDFIESHIAIYGESSITINIHNTSHVIDDVEMFGSLDTISAYKFESLLHDLKLGLQQCNHPLAQIVRRVSETAAVSKPNLHKPNENFPKLNYPFVTPENIAAFREIKYKSKATLSSRSGKDKWFLTNKNQIVELEYITKVQNKYMIRGCVLKNVEDFFKLPFDSRHLNIFMCDNEKFASQFFEIDVIKAKMFAIPYKNKNVFIPLLHTL